MPGVPADKVGLRLLLVTGQSHGFSFDPSLTAEEVVRHVFSHWPEEWNECPVDRPQYLRLIYHGKFIGDNVTMKNLSLPTGKTTVLHLIVKERPPDQFQERQRHGPGRKNNPQQDGCCILL